MSVSQVFSMGWSGSGGNTITSAITFTSDTAVISEFTIASGTVADQEQILAIDISQLKAIEIVVTGNDLATVTMETNSGSAADDTLVFPAGGGRFFWDNTFPTIDGTSGNPFDADVTTTFWSHNAAEEVTVKIRALY